MSIIKDQQVVFHEQPDGAIGVSVRNEADDGWVHLPGLMFELRALAQHGVPTLSLVLALRACELAHMANIDQFGTGSSKGKREWLEQTPFGFMEVMW